jgi:hypothetical protein
MVSTSGVMDDPTKGTGKTIKCTVMEFTYGKMEESMKEIMSMIKNKGKESTTGQTANFFKENGLTENDKDSEKLSVTLANAKSVCGKMTKR